MNGLIVDTTDGVTLVGGGPVGAAILGFALRRAPVLVAADAGADRIIKAGRMPEAVIGDLDSISESARAVIPISRQHLIEEQETTDFDKALRSIRAPFVLALGFSGGRVDHALAVFNAMASQGRHHCVVLSEDDAVFLCPPRLRLTLPVGERLSLFPMGKVSGESRGLRWPISGLEFSPDGRIGTSNMVSEPEVSLTFDRGRMMVIVPRTRLDAVLSALVPQWRPLHGGRGRQHVRGG